VTRHLKRAQVPLRRRPLTADQVKTALELYASGQSLAMVGEQLGCHGNTVRLALIRAGIPRRDTHGQDR
jgi:DNA invertase Pin-like site-specific DNA recombinase